MSALRDTVEAVETLQIESLPWVRIRPNLVVKAVFSNARKPTNASLFLRWLDMPIETHRSPDGLLTFVVEDVGDGDIALGFGYEWHTHPNLLVGTWGHTEAAATRAFTAEILNNLLVILVRCRDDQIVDVMVSDDPEFDADLLKEGEMLDMRYWDGRPWVLPPR